MTELSIILSITAFGFSCIAMLRANISGERVDDNYRLVKDQAERITSLERFRDGVKSATKHY